MIINSLSFRLGVAFFGSLGARGVGAGRLGCAQGTCRDSPCASVFVSVGCLACPLGLLIGDLGAAYQFLLYLLYHIAFSRLVRAVSVQ